MVPWSIPEALAVFLIFTLLALFGGEFRQLLEGLFALFSMEVSPFGLFVIFSLLQFGVFLAYMYGVVRGRYGMDFSVFTPRRYTLAQTLGYGLLSGLLVFVITMASIFFVLLVAPMEPEPQAITEFLGFASTNLDRLWVFVIIVFLAPISEELYFRGFLFHAIRNRLPFHLSVAVTSVIFGALHFDLFRFVSFFVAGVVLSHVYEKYQNLYIPMIAHGLWNGIMVIALFQTLGG